MKNAKNLIKLMDNISEKEIVKLRKSYDNDKKLDDYLYKTLSKIFKKLMSSYFRFEILLRCIDDIKENNSYYPSVNKKQLRKIGVIYNKLQKICLLLNLASEEFNKMIIYIEKRSA